MESCQSGSSGEKRLSCFSREPRDGRGYAFGSRAPDEWDSLVTLRVIPRSGKNQRVTKIYLRWDVGAV